MIHRLPGYDFKSINIKKVFCLRGNYGDDIYNMVFHKFHIGVFLIVTTIAGSCHSPKEQQNDQENSIYTEKILPLKNPGNLDFRVENQKLPRDQFGDSKWENPHWKQQNTEPSQISHEYKTDLHENYPVNFTINKNTQSSQYSKAKITNSSQIQVLCYHHNYSGKNTFAGFNVTPKNLEKQFRYLFEQGFKSISLAMLDSYLSNPGYRLPEKSIILTFDDGIKSNLTTVLPLLKKYKFKAVLFIYPGVISGRNKYYLNWKQLGKLARSGHFEIGSHSLNHPRLPEHSAREIRRQLNKSKSILERKLGIKIISFAYPFGVYDKRVIAELNASEYKLAFTIHPGSITKNMNPYTLNRSMVTNSHSMSAFIKMIKLRSSPLSIIKPDPGSKIYPGDNLNLTLNNHTNVRIKLAGRRLKLTKSRNTISAKLPGINSKLGYLPLQIRAIDQNGIAVYREYLYLDARKIRK